VSQGRRDVAFRRKRQTGAVAQVSPEQSDIEDELDREAQPFGKVIGELVPEARHHIQLGLDTSRHQIGVQVFHLVARRVPIAGQEIRAEIGAAASRAVADTSCRSG
jgi:hypothetical protein